MICINYRPYIVIIILMSLMTFSSHVYAQNNEGWAGLTHQNSYSTPSDIINPNEEISFVDKWWMAIFNIDDDSNDDINNIKFTVTSPFEIIWDGNYQPTSVFCDTECTYNFESGPDGNPVNIPEGLSGGPSGIVGPGVTKNPIMKITREVTPAILSGLETDQTVTVRVTFTSMPLEDVRRVQIGIGVPKSPIGDPLIITHIEEQNDLVDWVESTGANEGLAFFAIHPDDIKLNQEYVLVTRLKSEKSQLILGDPAWKPSVATASDFEEQQPCPDHPSNQCEINHNDGLAVTFTADSLVDWQYCLAVVNSSFMYMQEVMSGLYPCEDGMYCVSEDSDGDGFNDHVDNCPYTPNPGQDDDDGDDIGDACDLNQKINVSIDIKPGSDPNCFNIDGHGVIPVAILGNESFNVTQVDPSTCKLQGMVVKIAGKSNKYLSHFDDVNFDGYEDLVLQIEDSDGSFDEGQTEAILTGYLYYEYGRTTIEGSDYICIVP